MNVFQVSSAAAQSVHTQQDRMQMNLGFNAETVNKKIELLKKYFQATVVSIRLYY